MLTRFRLQWEISDSDGGKLLKDFLKEQEISKTALTDIKFKGGQIQVNGEDVTVRYRLGKGDKLDVYFPAEEPSEGIKGSKLALKIIYEDEYLLVINKPAGMSTIPSREHPHGSLANAIVGYYEEIGMKTTAHIVTRLDRDTSGIVLIAKHRHTHHLLSKQQKEGSVKRIYEAFAEGSFSNENGTVDAPIGRRSDSIIEREVRQDGQNARTHFQVLKKYEDFTHVVLKLETGRTHQIRVHLAYIGHPLVGDDLYGGKLSFMKRQALHCTKLIFRHPYLKNEMSFLAPLEVDMAELLKAQKGS